MCQVISVRRGAMLCPVLLLRTHLSGAGAGGGAERPHGEQPGRRGEGRLHEERVRGRHQLRVAGYRALATVQVGWSEQPRVE